LLKKDTDEIIDEKAVSLNLIRVEIYRLSDQYTEQSQLLKAIERGDMSNGIQFHYIPKKDKPHPPNRENFKYMYRVIDSKKKQESSNFKNKFFKSKETPAALYS
jgi:hypothetical protein